MQKLFNSVKAFTKGLFTSKNEQQETNNGEKPPEQVQQDFESNIKKHLDSDKELKILILTNRNNFNKLVVDLCWKKILDLKNMYAKERRLAFQPKLVVLEEQHYERIIVQVAELIQSHYDIQIYYDKNELLKITKQKVLEEQCTKILFSKEELKDYFEFFCKSNQQFQQQFPALHLEYSNHYIKEIRKQYLIDQAFEIYKFDDCDELKATRLFQDDKEVMQWYKKKQSFN